MIAFSAVDEFSGMICGPPHFDTSVSSLVLRSSGLRSLQASTVGMVLPSRFEFAGMICGPTAFVSLVPSSGPSSTPASKRMMMIILYMASQRIV